jgi:ABC-type sugar transport system ATPase subunit
VVKVTLKKLTKKFNSKIAVNNLNLEIKDRELFCFVGPPGAGKTTVLRLIAGLERADEGEIYFDDKPVTDLPPGERNVGFFFENLALFPSRDGFENIAFPLRVRRLPENEVKRRVLEVAKMLKIEHLLDRLPRTFSGGEMQRVALARTIVWPRDVLILDEPLSNLDALLRVGMRVELKRLKDEIGQTTLYATHDPIEAMAMADRMAVMSQGVLQQCDIPTRLYGKPANRFVAGFIGSPSMNFINCSFVEEDGKAYLDASAFKLDVTPLADTIKSNAKSSELILGIRPEHIKILEKPSGASNVIRAIVYVAEPLGPKTVVTFSISRDIFIKSLGEPNVAYRIGDEKLLEFNLEKIYLFDSKSGSIVI